MIKIIYRAFFPQKLNTGGSRIIKYPSRMSYMNGSITFDQNLPKCPVRNNFSPWDSGFPSSNSHYESHENSNFDCYEISYQHPDWKFSVQFANGYKFSGSASRK